MIKLSKPRELIVQSVKDMVAAGETMFVLQAYRALRAHGLAAEDAIAELDAFCDDIIEMKKRRG